MQVFFRFFASKKTSQKAWISTYCPYLCRHDRGSEHPCRQYSRIRKQAVPIIFDATYTDHFPAGQAGKSAYTRCQGADSEYFGSFRIDETKLQL